MYKSSSLIGVLLLAAASLTAQNTKPAAAKSKATAEKKQTVEVIQPVTAPDPVLLIVGGDPVTRAEFESIYKKNNTQDALSNRKALEEYLELFINFKLKVKAAKDAGKDTVKAFRNELKGYRRQLAQPYLNDKDVTEKLLTEAYERMKKDVKASHILIKLPNDPLPKDTLAAYNRIMEIRNRILKGADFNAVAEEVSEDPSARQNRGDLGYFSSMMMVYPFETAAYTTPIGQISMPVRTKFGYHLVKVEDIRDAQGQVRVAHIMVQVRESAKDSVVEKVRAKAEEIYKRAIAGEDFAQLASTYSDDRTSGKNGGELPMFGTGKMVPEFEKASFALKNVGDISEPVRSSYGFHVIKLLEKKGIPSFDESKAELKQKISKDSRSQVSRDAVVARVKKELNFKEDPKALNELIQKIDTSYLSGKWDVSKANGMNKELFSLGGEKVTQKDFAEYLADNQAKQASDAIVEALVRKAYDSYLIDKVISAEDARLEEKYPEFRMLMQEYHDGILLFDITDENVWTKALQDTAGLRAFHEENKTKYMWGDRVEAVIYKAKDEKTAKATRKLVARRAKTNMPIEDIIGKINVKSALNLQVDDGIFSKGENDVIDNIKWEPGITPFQKNADGTVTFVEIRRFLPAQPKSLQEAKGLITADYQTFLEKKWIEELRAKYTVTVNREVFDSIR